jgi:hypothetical protein
MMAARMSSELPDPLYPRVDREETEMSKPFFKRQRTWRVLLGLAVMALVILQAA